MKIEIEVSEENEGTHAPYWQIIDPKILKNAIREIRKHGNDIKYEELARYIAFSTTGIFFSRKAANNHLKAKHYNFSKHAKVWCYSGYASFEYNEAIKEAENLRDLRITKALEFHVNNPNPDTGAE